MIMWMGCMNGQCCSETHNIAMSRLALPVLVAVDESK